MKKLELHWKILIGMLLGLVFGFVMLKVNGGEEFVNDWFKPLGTIFVKLLKLIAIPLILASLIKGISDLKDISKFANIGIRTIIIYVITTIIAISIGLILVNTFQPGEGVSEETIAKLTETYASDSSVQEKISDRGRRQVTDEQKDGVCGSVFCSFPAKWSLRIDVDEEHHKPGSLPGYVLWKGGCIFLYFY